MSNPIGYLDYAGAQYIVQQLQRKIDRKVDQSAIENYQIPIASDSKIGGIMVGDGLSINANGVLSSTVQSGASNWDEVKLTLYIFFDIIKIR